MSRAIRTFAVAIVLLGLSVPFRTQVLNEWSITVLDDSGHAVVNLVVAQSYADYRYGVSVNRDMKTDRNGRADFSPVSFWRPAGYWLVKRIGVMFNLHGGGGRAGRVWIPNDARIVFPPGVGISSGCFDDDCLEKPLESKFVVMRSAAK